MPLKTVKRGKIWYVRGMVKGQQIFESSGSTKRAIAEQLKLKRENEIHKHHNKEKTFTDAAIEYVLRGGEKRYIEKIDNMLGQYSLSEIDQNLLDVMARKAYPKAANSTIKRQFYTPFCAVMNAASNIGWVNYRRYKKPKEKRPAPDWVEIDWLEKLWEHSTPKLKALTTFLPYTGCRISECLSLEWDNVNISEGWAYIPDTKNGEPRTVYLPEIVLKRIQAIKSDGRVFEYSGRDVVKNELHRACKKAGIEYKSTHKIGSHTYATWMRRYAGLDAVGLVSTGRWKDPRSTYIYTHAKTSDEARKADMIPTSSAKVVQEGDK